MEQERLAAELEEAQARLEEKRRVLGVSQPPPPIGGSLLSQTTEHYEITEEDKEKIARYVCEEHGFVNPPYVVFPILNTLSIESCPDCRKEFLQRTALQDAKRAASEKAERVALNMARLNIGARFQGMTFDDYAPTCQDAVKVKAVCQKYTETFTDRLKDGDGLIFIGACGTGKNMLAAIICQEVVRQEKSTIHTTIFKLIRAIKDSWRRDSEKSEESVINSFSKPDLLVIDEVGVQFGSDTEKLYLTEIINNRYESRKPTVLISNLNLVELEGVLGTRIIDRFYEGKSAILKFTWESYRRRINAPVGTGSGGIMSEGEN